MKIDLRSLNKEFKDRNPSEIIQWVLKIFKTFAYKLILDLMK